MAAPAPAPRILLLLLLLLPAPPGAHSEVCIVSPGRNLFPKFCPDFCCGTCFDQYCCSDVLKKFVWNGEECGVLEARFGTTVAVGLTIFVLSVVTIIICFTCSCCYLYKMCCRPRPVVTTTTSTTVVHSPYSQAPSVPPSYPGPTYQGYHAMPPQPGMPAAPYPTQYPPPYPAQPMGPPAYHETMAGGAAMPYPASQPPYNPAYMDPPKAAP
ncbi:protein shisa-5 isoform X2 [Physeter macrocephalus]|uniref:Protein shisa-5 n=1 Tax=Physeter macrocephalus TaxID=9755 RepID=A0A2Y9SQ30_PHYMC|nr:protein shisa-5 isoform X2 [Physeter catodon]|eukprot:XP_023979532.1 protein shisa-5 isoform X1 [Physeter catodon]